MSAPPRNDGRFIEDARIALAIYCDECGLTRDEGVELAEHLADELLVVADDREGS